MPFDDIHKEHSWALPYINKAASLGIIGGQNGHFRPNDSITRAETAKIVDRTQEFKQ